MFAAVCQDEKDHDMLEDEETIRVYVKTSVHEWIDPKRVQLVPKRVQQSNSGSKFCPLLILVKAC